VNLGLMLVGANTFFAKIYIPAPAAADKALLITHCATNHTSLQQFSYNVARVLAPSVQHFTLFADSFQVVMVHHGRLPIFLTSSRAIVGPMFIAPDPDARNFSNHFGFKQMTMRGI
jgi:hypothetical protein